jgi:hypothetical protein
MKPRKSARPSPSEEPIEITTVHDRALEIRGILALVIPALRGALEQERRGEQFSGQSNLTIDDVLESAVERLDDIANEAWWLELANLTHIGAPTTEEKEALERQQLKARRAS